MSDRRENFSSALKRLLAGCDYKSRGGGIYTRGNRESPMDWLSVSGNSYFCIINAGVVFPDLSNELVTLLPKGGNESGLTGLNSTMLPFVFGPIQHYVSLPPSLNSPSADRMLTPVDAGTLANIACGPLLQALSPFHSVPAATAEVRATLGVGNAKSFLLVLAYVKQGQAEAARSIASEIQAAMKAEAVRAHYGLFLRNLGSKYGVNLTSTA